MEFTFSFKTFALSEKKIFFLKLNLYEIGKYEGLE
jgi:hypothetical protein